MSVGELPVGIDAHGEEFEVVYSVRGATGPESSLQHASVWLSSALATRQQQPNGSKGTLERMCDEADSLEGDVSKLHRDGRDFQT